ncbi:MAG: hypothetical protein AB8B99_07930 [Phormidesmis sp.]
MIKSLLSKGAQQIGRLADKLSSLRAHRPKKILLYLNLPQDLDMLLPLITRLKASTTYPIAVAVSDKAWNQSPRIGTLLSATGIAPQIVSHKAAVAGLQPSVNNVSALITASESTANAHKGAYTLTQRVNQTGAATYTMQHGYENVGITYFDEEYPVGKIMFASQKIFTWVPLATIPAKTPAETRAKCVAIGCPKFVDAPGIKANVPGRKPDSPLVAVFENVHWCRYSDDYRQRFLQDLEQMAIAHPHITFLVKPHHTGLWLTKRYQGKVPVADNLIIADPKDPTWEVFTAPALIEIADMVITTPSTVAIDAVRANTNVAIVAYDMDLPNYEPLMLLRSGEDWRSLLRTLAPQRPPDPQLTPNPQNTNAPNPDRTNLNSLNPDSANADASSTAALTHRTAKFSQTRLVPGDAVQRIIDMVTSDIATPDTATAKATQ